MSHHSAALADYVAAFAEADEPFLTYHAILPDKSVRREHFSRGAVWSLARRAAGVLRAHGLGLGDCVAHHFTANRPADLAFRLGATMVGAMWGVFIWKEFADAPPGTNRLLGAMFASFIVGLVLIIAARLV